MAAEHREALLERYRQERDKRLVPNRAAVQELTGEFARFLDDPFTPRVSRDPVREEVDVLVVGAGFSGLLAGVTLREAGVDDIRLVDRAGDVGGTWYWNRYPGAMCDVESYIYLPLLEETGYVPTRKYAFAPEILAYTQLIADRYDLRRRVLFHTAAQRARWDEDGAAWVVTTDRGDELRAQFLVLAAGFLAHPKIPGLPGLEFFRGRAFHTSRWDYAYTGGDCESELVGLRDRVVGVVGTAASAVQCVPPVGHAARQLYVFQRTPAAVTVRGNHPTAPDWAASLEPGWQRQRMENFAMLSAGTAKPGIDMVNDGWTNIFGALSIDPSLDIEVMDAVRARVDSIVKDRATAEVLKPYYPYQCRRPLFHDEYLDTFNLPNVKLVNCPAGIERVYDRGVVVDGVEYDVDCLVFATGFEDYHTYRLRSSSIMVGRDGTNLADRWAHGVRSLHGLMSRGFPNLLILPDSQAQTAVTVNFTHGTFERARHIAYIIGELRRRNVRFFDVEADAEDDWVQRIVADFRPEALAFLNACTPGRGNNEGRLETINPQNRPFGGRSGWVTYFQMLADWRADGRLAGLELDGGVSP